MCYLQDMFLSDFIKTRKNAAEVARICGVPQQIIGTFQRGSRGLSAETMAKIVEATGGQVSYEELVAEMRENRSARRKKLEVPASPGPLE